MGSRPSSSSLSAATTRQTDAASFWELELPAVTEPSFIRGRSLARDSIEESLRGPSSASNITGGPRRWGTGTGTISFLNLPSSEAATAR